MRVFISWFLTISLLVGGLPAAAHGPIPTCESSALTPAQTEALIEARRARHDYAVRVLSGDVNGIPRTVVLLGEQHLKYEEAWSLGTAVVDQIPDVGYEGAAAGAHGPFVRLMLKALSARHYIAVRSGLKDSTIHYARGRDAGTNAPLETGHQFTLKEKLLFAVIIANGVVEGAIGGAIVGSVCMVPGGLVASDPMISAGGLLGTGVFALVMKAWAYVTGAVGHSVMTYVFCGSRNDTMVENIERHLREHPEVTKLLVIVGQAHVNGMNRLLLQRNFWNVPL